MNPLTEWLYTYFDEADPVEFYRDVFPSGSLDEAGAMTKGKYTGIVCAFENLTPEQRAAKKRPKVYRYTVTDDLDTIREVVKTDMFCIMSPLSYAGKSRSAEMARDIYGIAIDLDKIYITEAGKPNGLINLWERHIGMAERVPKPTYIVSSGTGVHLYYLFERPIRLFPETARQLQRLKKDITQLCWTGAITTIHDLKEIQFEGIYQGFRMPGTITKTGTRVRAFLTGPRVTVDYLNEFALRPENRVTDLTYKSACSLEEAKEKFPDWYRRRIEQGESRGAWHTNRAVYDWWKGQILAGASVGHRYFCLWTLAIYARKCSHYDAKHNPNPVTYEELERDALELMEVFEKKTTDERNHFDETDVQAALEGFNEGWTRYHRDYIAFRSAIPIKENKRNHRKQEAHLKIARFVQEFDGKEWRNMSGRPPGSGTKEAVVREWRKAHPEGTVTEAARDLKASRTTIYKYWNS